MPEVKEEWQLTKQEREEFTMMYQVNTGDRAAMETLSMIMSDHKMKEAALWNKIIKSHGIPAELRYKLSYSSDSGKIFAMP